MRGARARRPVDAPPAPRAGWLTTFDSTYFSGDVGKNVWIGYSDVTTEGTWKWEDADTSTYTSWNTGDA